MAAGQIELSIVVAGSRPEGPSPRLLDAVAEVLRSGRAEVIVVTTRKDAGPNRSGTTTLVCEQGTTVPRLRSIGFDKARGGIVALTEDFCAPDPGWAEALLSAHERSPAVAIGGPMDRHTGRVSAWAWTLCEYGRFFRLRTAGAVSDLAGTNVSYKAAGLRELLGGLPDEFQEVFVHERLRERGGTLFWEPRARMYDESDRPFGSSLRALYHHGRLYGSQRIGNGLGARVFRLLASPLVPCVQLYRIARAVIPSHAMPLLRSLPELLCLLIAWAIGEGIGSIAGMGGSKERWT